MHKTLVALALVAGCGTADLQQAENNAAPAAAGTANQTASAPAEDEQSESGESVRLTGLFEGGKAERPDQLCMIERGQGKAQFGLVVWGSNMSSCAGAGEATQKGDTLRLTMSGDKSCAIEATVSGGTVTLPASVPEGCAYYCGAQARLTGTKLTRKGGTRADAQKAKDLAGDPLCGAPAS